MQNKRSINIIGWLLAAITIVVYGYTMYPTLSFWDSGDFLASAAGLQIPHPPGAPFYQIVAAFLSIFGFNNPTITTYLIAFLSPLSMGLSTAFLFWVLVRMLSRFSTMQPGNIIASIIASLCFAFADSIWFSATETEVYALSTLLSFITLWLVLKWDDNRKTKYFLLAVYTLSLGLCVHQLSLLILPPIAVILYFHQRRTNYKGLILYIIAGALAVLLILFVLVPFILALLSWIQWYAILLLLLIIGIGLFIARKYKKASLEFSLLAILLFCVGLSTYLIIPIRSVENPPLNSYSPSSFEAMKAYVNRENYSKAPLIYGQQYTAIPPEKFELDSKGLKPIFAKEQKTIFPRMWNYETSAAENGYIEWTGLPENSVNINGEERPKPSFAQNLRFFFSYQTNYMYFRYLLWNFCGRTNDVQGYGDYKNSQWASGIKFVDEFLGVATNELNPQAAKGRNYYYAIPLLLALFGLFYQASKDAKHFTVNATLFFFNSIALVIFLNQSAYQARERDYVFLMSFAAICIWIAMGVFGISNIIVNLVKLRRPKYVAPVFFFVPALMFFENFDDHNHRHQYTAENFAVSMLQTCEKDAILFTNGDNDTYPLWYAQNVKKIRQDVRVINLSLLNGQDCINTLTRKVYNSAPLDMVLSPKEYENRYFYGQINPAFDTLMLKDAIVSFTNEKQSAEFFGTKVHYFASNRFILPVGEDTLKWKYDVLDISRSTLVAMDLIAANIESRPIYFSSYSIDDFFGLEDYMQLEGFAYRLGTKKQSKAEIIQQKAGFINEEKMFANFTKAFQWKNFNKEGVYYNEIEREIVQQYVQHSICLAYKLFDTKRMDDALSVCKQLTHSFPMSQHRNPLAEADIAMLYGLLGEESLSELYIDKSVQAMSAAISNYTKLKSRQQSQERVEMQNLIGQWLRLINQAEDFNLENIRISLADEYFNVIDGYLKTSFEQLERMWQRADFYSEEINRTLEQLNIIYGMAEAYEEQLREPPAFLLQNSLEVE